MLTFNKTINVNGVSTIDIDGKQIQAAYMNASINVNGAFNSNHSIQNKGIFEAHKDEVLEDFATFDDYVYEIAKEADMKAELDTAAGGGKDAKTILQN